MNSVSDSSDPLPDPCTMSREWLAHGLDATNAEAVEQHLSECESCLAFAQQLEEELPAIDTDAFQAENDLVQTPISLRETIVSEVDWQRRKPVAATQGQARFIGVGARLAIACSVVAIVVSIWWMTSQPVLVTESTDSPAAALPGRRAPLRPPSSNVPDESSVPASSAVEPTISAIAGEGFVLAVESTEPEEIPFIWVVPQSDR